MKREQQTGEMGRREVGELRMLKNQLEAQVKSHLEVRRWWWGGVESWVVGIWGEGE